MIDDLILSISELTGAGEVMSVIQSENRVRYIQSHPVIRRYPTPRLDSTDGIGDTVPWFMPHASFQAHRPQHGRRALEGTFKYSYALFHGYVHGLVWLIIAVWGRIRLILNISRLFYFLQLFIGLLFLVVLNELVNNTDKITTPIIFLTVLAPSFLSTIYRAYSTIICSFVGVIVGLIFVLAGAPIWIGIPFGFIIAYAICVMLHFPGGLVAAAFGVVYVQIYVAQWSTPLFLIVTRMGGITLAVLTALVLNLISPSLFTSRFFHKAAGTLESAVLANIPQTVLKGPKASRGVLSNISSYLLECDAQLAEWQFRGLHDKRTDLLKLRRHIVRLELTVQLAVDLHYLLVFEHVSMRAFSRSEDFCVLCDSCYRRVTPVMDRFTEYDSPDIGAVYLKIASLLDVIFTIDEPVLASLIPSKKTGVVEQDPLAGSPLSIGTIAGSPAFSMRARATGRFADDMLIPMDLTATIRQEQKNIRMVRRRGSV
ncbi:hypothetical protein J8273_3284 [Carpediemonas membranifera]|uniref:Uncharacterized protein n=1 Tax=Carpediemonas membranifera TaxID=201153 RepID=A0A8J6AUZ2_9EUKA|nr:hypothetical protein J8273_3284 [Carpediemonas membranifera]|eukprot:KAG9393155.1 hypothetical protein J8273_3284 [Carpediemonas membranifera]